MRIILLIANILVDICGVVCMIMTVRFIRMYPERSRKCTVITGAAALAVSVITSVTVALNIPDTVYSSGAGLLTDTPEYEQYAFLSAAASFVTTCLFLITPLIILRVRRVFRTLLTILTLAFAVEAVFSYVSLIAGLNEDNPSQELAEVICNIAVYLALIVILGFSMRKERALPLHEVMDSMPVWLFVVAVISLYGVYAKTQLFDGGGDTEYLTTVYNVIWAVSTAGIMIAAGYFVFKIFTLSYRQNQIIKQMDQQQKHYEQTLKNDEKLREFRHDYKNHMMVVTALLNSGRTEEAADYLEKVKAVSGTAGRQFNTGSFIADAVLNNKNPLAEEFAIHIGFAGRIPSEGIENSDLCTVFANLVDNAIEGTKRYNGNRYINIESNVRNGMMALSVYNPVNEKVNIKNNRIKTTKSDARNHGIGLKNVERVAEKYHGHLLLSCDEKEFGADVSLKLDNSGEEN